MSTLCSELPAVCGNVASRLQNLVRDVVSAPCSVEKERCLSVAAAHGMDHLPINSGCSWTSSVMKALQTLRPCPLHPYLVLVSSCPSMAMQVEQCLSHPLPPATPTGQKEQRGERMFRQAPCKYRAKREVPEQPAWPPALHCDTDCVPHLSAWCGFSWEYPGAWQG